MVGPAPTKPVKWIGKYNNKSEIVVSETWHDARCQVLALLQCEPHEALVERLDPNED